MSQSMKDRDGSGFYVLRRKNLRLKKSVYHMFKKLMKLRI